MRRLFTALAMVLLVLLASGVAATNSAFTASVKTPLNPATTARWFRCVDAIGRDRDNMVLSWNLANYRTGLMPDLTPQGNDGVFRGAASWERTEPIACKRDRGDAYVLDGSSSHVTSRVEYLAPAEFSLEIWFKTAGSTGKLIGFESAATGPGDSYDRHLYLTSAGNVVFGVYDPAASPQRQTIASQGGLDDDRWHHAIGTISPGRGATLYIDGRAVSVDPVMGAADQYRGYWRVGQGKLDNWPNHGADDSTFFAGSLRFAGVYLVALDEATVAAHWSASR